MQTLKKFTSCFPLPVWEEKRMLTRVLLTLRLSCETLQKTFAQYAQKRITIARAKARRHLLLSQAKECRIIKYSINTLRINTCRVNLMWLPQVRKIVKMFCKSHPASTQRQSTDYCISLSSMVERKRIIQQKLTGPTLCRPARNWLWTGQLLSSCWLLSPFRFCSLLLNLALMSWLEVK